MADTLDDFYGTDILHERDFIKAEESGELQTQSGLENLKTALLRRLVTEPGTIIHRPTFGVGIKRFQNAPNTLSNRQGLALRINDQFRQDPRIEEVLGVAIQSDPKEPSLVTITVRVKAKGFGETSISYQPFGGF